MASETESTICACGHGPEYHDLTACSGDSDWACSFADCDCDDWDPQPEPAP